MAYGRISSVSAISSWRRSGLLAAQGDRKEAAQQSRSDSDDEQLSAQERTAM